MKCSALFLYLICLKRKFYEIHFRSKPIARLKMSRQKCAPGWDSEAGDSGSPGSGGKLRPHSFPHVASHACRQVGINNINSWGFLLT